MREITAGKLNKILKEHKRWCENEDEGEKANLSGANLKEANLFDSILNEANLSNANLSCADLSCAYLRGAELTQVQNLSIEQLSKVKTLYEAELDPKLMKQVRKKYPHLLEEPVEEEEE